MNKNRYGSHCTALHYTCSSFHVLKSGVRRRPEKIDYSWDQVGILVFENNSSIWKYMSTSPQPNISYYAFHTKTLWVATWRPNKVPSARTSRLVLCSSCFLICPAVVMKQNMINVRIVVLKWTDIMKGPLLGTQGTQQ